MGLFSRKIKLLAPMSGELIDVTKVKDITFAEKMLGDGVAIIPSDGKIVAPADGKIVNVFHTKHAIGIETSKLELLIHIGMDTVELKGEGFTLHTNQGDNVKAGDLLLEVDLDYLKEKGFETTTPIVITNMEIVKNLSKNTGNVVAGKDEIMVVTK